ncbi:MAG: AarF/ABC1/UbiB kinase family protein [Weeksellaceae bacterium]|nr:AarF/ABC1/UbiB kinase family protein [Weeksellaceae bacterium]
MKSVNKIPVSKLARAKHIVSTGAKVGVNYLNYYKDKITKTEEEARDTLNSSNAEDIYESLSSLKGSPLKVAQMLSMEKNILPQQYVDKFSLAQFSVPPLSAPLVNKVFRDHFGEAPNKFFDEFQTDSHKAASIGQVHRAKKDGKELAVKIQYPGVADSISSDLRLVKPIALRMFNLPTKDSEKYFKEVEGKLLEETDYTLELQQSIEVSEACAHIPNLKFPTYYPDWSSDKILTMDFMHGQHLSEFAAENQDPQLANQIGQALWDFYMFQIHERKKVHADPHPGNFLVSPDHQLIPLDFGCMKTIPIDFYEPYFQLANPQLLKNQDDFQQKLLQLEIIKASDKPADRQLFTEIFQQLISLLAKPFQQDTFNFADKNFFDQVYGIAEKYGNQKELKSMSGNRGSEHFLYINRTFFGLYSLMHQLQASHINTANYTPQIGESGV